MEVFPFFARLINNDLLIASACLGSSEEGLLYALPPSNKVHVC